MSDDEYVDGPPSGAPAWREVWERDRRFRPRPGRQEWFLRVARRVVRRAGEPDAERQKNFNLVLLDLLDDFRRDLDQLRRDFKSDLEALQGDMRAADAALAADLAAIHALIPLSAKRNDALIAALDQKIETLAVRLRDTTNPAVRTAAAAAAASSDFLYRRLEDGLRGSEEEVRAAVAPYVERAHGHEPLLDVGCGRGELLAACRAAGITARGFDTNERSVADLVARGFDATVAAIPDCFRGIPDASVGTVSALHVVEHLPVAVFFALFAEAARVLRPGGLLLIETPNAESMLVSASELWRDPTHLAPRHPAALVLLAREHGFDIDEVLAVHPFPEGTPIAVAESDPPELRRVTQAVNERLFAPQDLRFIARKR
jgi:SAM-dependent methyltransferase